MMGQQQHQQQQARPSQVAENYAATMAAMAGCSAGMSANRDYNFLNHPVIGNIQSLNTQQMEQMQQAQAQAQAQSLARGQVTRHLGGWMWLGQCRLYSLSMAIACMCKG